jgi:hypothetical protein
MKALEEEAAAEGLKTLWKSAKLEVESVIRASSPHSSSPTPRPCPSSHLDGDISC